MRRSNGHFLGGFLMRSDRCSLSLSAICVVLIALAISFLLTLDLQTATATEASDRSVVSAPRAAGPQPMRYTAPDRTGMIDLVLRRDGSYLLLLDGGVAVAGMDIDRTSEVLIGGPDHHDTSLTVDYAFGPIRIPIDYHPGALGPNTDNLLSIRGAAFDTETHVITGPHSGVITLDDVPIVYSNLTPIDDTTPVTNFTFTALGAATININTGPNVLGSQTDQINDGGTSTFELYNFANKTNVTVVGDSATITTFTVNILSAATGLTTLNVQGGGAGSVFNVQATPASITTNVVGRAIDSVNVGFGGSTQAILGPVNIENPPSSNTIVVDDSSDVTGRTVTLTFFTPSN